MVDTRRSKHRKLMVKMSATTIMMVMIIMTFMDNSTMELSYIMVNVTGL